MIKFCLRCGRGYPSVLFSDCPRCGCHLRLINPPYRGGSGSCSNDKQIKNDASDKNDPSDAITDKTDEIDAVADDGSKTQESLDGDKKTNPNALNDVSGHNDYEKKEQNRLRRNRVLKRLLWIVMVIGVVSAIVIVVVRFSREKCPKCGERDCELINRECYDSIMTYRIEYSSGFENEHYRGHGHRDELVPVKTDFYHEHWICRKCG